MMRERERERERDESCSGNQNHLSLNYREISCENWKLSITLNKKYKTYSFKKIVVEHILNS